MSRLQDTQSEIDWREYEHFEAFGWGEQWVADRLGVELGSLRTAMARRAARQARGGAVAS